MGVRLSSQEDVVCLFDSTVGQAFGPVFEGDAADEKADLFLDWYRSVFPADIRSDWFAGNTALVMDRFNCWWKVVHHAETGEFNPSVTEGLIRSKVDVS
jgi:hypothetical protein